MLPAQKVLDSKQVSVFSAPIPVHPTVYYKEMIMQGEIYVKDRSMSIDDDSWQWHINGTIFFSRQRGHISDISDYQKDIAWSFIKSSFFYEGAHPNMNQ